MTARGHSPFSIIRFGLAISQAILGLFGAGSAIFAAHTLFLRYYGREWSGIKFAGVNDCGGLDRVANGDLFEGQTFCNKPLNFLPWLELYRRHWQVALTYYSVLLILLLIVGWIFLALQRRIGSTTPFGRSAPLPVPADSEHLR